LAATGLKLTDRECKTCRNPLIIGLNWSEYYQAKCWYTCVPCDSTRRVAARNKKRLDAIRTKYADVLKSLNTLTTGVREGFVYVMTNNAWPGFVKIGRAVDPEDRLASFQVADPLRGYELRYYRFFPDRYAAEAAAHMALGEARLSGEWFAVSVEEAINVVKRL
jgi:hypothetical protein